MGVPLLVVGLIGIVASIGGWLHIKHQHHNDQRQQNTWQAVGTGRGRFVLTVNSNNYNIEYDIKATPRELAFEFCSHTGSKLGYTVETLHDCVTPIEKEIVSILNMNAYAIQQQQQQQQQLYEQQLYEQQLYEQQLYQQQLYQQQQQQQQQQEQMQDEIPLQENMMEIKLIFNEKEYNVLYTLGTTPKEFALEFCSRKGAELGFSMETIPQCIKPVEREITSRFGETLGTSSDDIKTEEPIVEQIPELTTKGKDIDAIDLVLEINGVNYVFQYPTNLDTTVAAKSLAEEFCNRKAYDLNIPGLADDNDDEYNNNLIKEYCYDPLVDALYYELNKEQKQEKTDEEF